MKEFLLFVCLILFLATGADAQEVYKSKDEKSLPDSGEYIKVNKVISISPGDIRSNDAQNQLIQKEPYDSIIEARRLNVKEFVSKTFLEYANGGYKADPNGEELWNRLSPYFPGSAQVVSQGYEKGGSASAPEYFFTRNFPGNCESGRMKGKTIANEDITFEFALGSDKIRAFMIHMPYNVGSP